MYRGDPVRGEYNGTSIGAPEVPIYREGSLNAHTLAADEILVITEALIDCAVGNSELRLFIGADSTPGAGETVIHVKFPAAGTAMMERVGIEVSTGAGNKPYLLGDTADARCQFSGYIQKV